MLVDSTRTIAEVCYDCGFNNLSNFNRMFKRKKGCSPKEFRENYRKKEAGDMIKKVLVFFIESAYFCTND